MTILELPPATLDTPPLTVFTCAVSLDLPHGFGQLVVDEELDFATGTAYYRIVKADRARGSFTIRPNHHGLTPVPTDAGVWYGRGLPGVKQCDRTDRPVVNGITLARGAHFDHPERWRTMTHRDVAVHEAITRDSVSRAPHKTAERVGWIVIALLARYTSHPDYRELLEAAAGYDATTRLRDTRREIAERTAKIAELTAELADHTDRERKLQILAADHARRTVAASYFHNIPVA